MMRRQRPQDNSLGEQDEHDQPTEPMPRIIPSSSSPTASPIAAAQIPVPQAYERPFPKQDGNGFPDITNRPPEAFAYPYQPSAPEGRRHGRPPGGAIPASPGDSSQLYPRRSPWPVLVGIFFIAVQLLLLVRLVLKIIDKPGNIADIIYNTSDVFVLPFRLLLQNVALPHIITSNVEVYTVLAILAYWLLSRILVHLLKALLYAR